MTEHEEVVWLAGLLEGEGFFGTITNWVSGRGYKYPRIGVLMTDRDVVERAASVLGSSVYPLRKAYGTGSKKPSFRTIVQGGKAAAWMERLRPFMGARRCEQIDAALEQWKNRPSAKDRRSKSMKAVAANRQRNNYGQFITEKTSSCEWE